MTNTTKKKKTTSPPPTTKTVGPAVQAHFLRGASSTYVHVHSTVADLILIVMED